MSEQLIKKEMYFFCWIVELYNIMYMFSRALTPERERERERIICELFSPHIAHCLEIFSFSFLLKIFYA